MRKTYAVVWEDGLGRNVGKLTIASNGFLLAGGSAGLELDVLVPGDEIVSVGTERIAGERLDGRPTIAVALADGRTLRLGCVDGPGSAHEISRRLAQLIPVSSGHNP